MMPNADDQTDGQKLLGLANTCGYCDQGIMDYITYIFTTNL